MTATGERDDLIGTPAGYNIDCSNVDTRPVTAGDDFSIEVCNELGEDMAKSIYNIDCSNVDTPPVTAGGGFSIADHHNWHYWEGLG